MPESIFENFNSIWEGAVNKGTSFEGCRLKRGQLISALCNVTRQFVEFEAVFEYVEPSDVWAHYKDLMEMDTTNRNIVRRLDLKRKHDLFWAALNGGGGLLTVERTGRVFDIGYLF